MNFRSGLERQVAELLKQLNIKFEYESLKLQYTIPHDYTPDFILPNGVILEAKGYWSAEDRRKIKAVIAQNPNIDLRMVFMAPTKKISKRSRTSYAQYCEQRGIKWCSFKKIPYTWLCSQQDISPQSND